jgi:hypothetical protein
LSATHNEGSVTYSHGDVQVSITLLKFSQCLAPPQKKSPIENTFAFTKDILSFHIFKNFPYRITLLLRKVQMKSPQMQFNHPPAAMTRNFEDSSKMVIGP